MTNYQLAQELARRGMLVFPCGPNKKPLTPHGYKDATNDPAKIADWWNAHPGALIGIPCEPNGIFALDIDTKKGVNGYESWAQLVETHGEGQGVECGPAQHTPSGGAHLIFALPPDVKIPNNAGKLAPGLDFRSRGYICSGMLPDGSGYSWQPGHDYTTRLTMPPAWLIDLIRAMNAAKTPPRMTQDNGHRHTPTDSGAFWLSRALSVAHNGNRNETGFWLSCQLRDAGLTQEEAKSILADYAARVPGDGYSEREALASCKSAFTQAQRDPARSLSASLRAPQTTELQAPENFAPGELPAHGNEPNAPKLLTDMGNAARFAEQHAGRVRHVAQWGWLVWDGRRWELDERGRVMQFAKKTALSLYDDAQNALQRVLSKIQAAKEAAAQTNTDPAAVTAAVLDAEKANKKAFEDANKLLAWALKCQNRDRLEAMLTLTRSEPAISARPGDFDGDPWALNVHNGILDLRTGHIRPHDPGANISKLAGAAYDPAARCPTWLKFLDRIFKGDSAMIGFIQRAVGYSLTGQTSEQCLFFLYGMGANGKSTFTETIQALLGDYARKTPTDSLMVKSYDGGIPNDIARLAGARLVSAAELSEGKRLNEALVKDLTGGDLITARYLNREFFEFSPRFKLWIYGNHKPEIRGTDGGIWRRVRLIPFEVTIPEHEQDKALPAKLRAELPGILAWAVEGCKTWQREGLTPPATVTQATADYRQSQDQIGLFISECCTLNPIATAAAGGLYNLYKTWATDNGLTPISNVKFSQSMTEKGFLKARKPGDGTVMYSGIGILATA